MAKTDEPAGDTPERLVRMIPEANRARLQKELLGLTAKLKWDHVSPGMKEVWQARIDAIREELKE
jgi:hypothetical protein